MAKPCSVLLAIIYTRFLRYIGNDYYLATRSYSIFAKWQVNVPTQSYVIYSEYLLISQFSIAIMLILTDVTARLY